jgi:hypothetical protein
MNQDGRLPKISSSKSLNVLSIFIPTNIVQDEINSGYKTPENQYIKKLDKPPSIKRKVSIDNFLPKI